MQRILLIDDDIDDQLYFRDAINEVSPDTKCDTANNGREALTQIDVPPPPDLIFLDLNMPVMDGYECLAVLKSKQKYKDIPVIVFTTSKNPADIQRSQQLGASLFMTKTTNFGVLCGALENILGLDFSSTSFASVN